MKHRALSPVLRELLAQMSEHGSAMDVLRTAVSAMTAEDPEEGDNWKGRTRYLDMQERLVAAIAERRPRMSPAAADKVNVDLFAATTYTFLGIPARADSPSMGA